MSWNSTCFGQFVCPSSRFYSLCTQQWYISYRFVDSFRAGPGWNILVLLESFLHTCVAYTILECTVNKLLMMDKLSETCRVSWQNKFVKLVHLVGFITKKVLPVYSTLIVRYRWNYRAFTHFVKIDAGWTAIFLTS